MEKVTIRTSLKKRIEERMRIAEDGVKNAGPEPSAFWQGYKAALDFIKESLVSPSKPAK